MPREINIPKHNSLNKYSAYFSEIFISRIVTNYFVLIDTIDANMFHVDIMLMINSHHKQREDFQHGL